MQKCPKCGTILDDSKTTCYVCGTNVIEAVNLQAQQAAQAQQVTQPEQPLETLEVLDDTTVGQNATSTDITNNTSNIDMFYSDEFNKLNSQNNLVDAPQKQEPKEDKKAKKEKKKKQEEQQEVTVQTYEQNPIFAFPEEFDSFKGNTPTPEINQMPEQVTQTPPTTNTEIPIGSEVVDQSANVKNSQFFNDVPVDNKKPQKPKKSKENSYFAYDEYEENSKPTRFKFSTIFNLICVVLFVIVVFMAAKHFFAPSDKHTKIGGLTYKIDDKFELASTDGNSRLYKLTEGCTVRIEYGQTSEGDSFVDNYLSSMKSSFEEDLDTKTQEDEIRVNDNTWKSVSVIKFVPIEGQEAYEHFIKYKYVSIFHNGNFYHTILLNRENDKECVDLQDAFIKSLSFE